LAFYARFSAGLFPTEVVDDYHYSVVYGLMRYIQDIYEKMRRKPGEGAFIRPTLLITVVIWAILVVALVYFINPS